MDDNRFRCFAKSISIILFLFCCSMLNAADMEVYIKHSSGLVLGQKSDGHACLVAVSGAKKVKLRDVGGGYYLIVNTEADGSETYMTLNGSWNTFFENDPKTDKAMYAIEGDKEQLFKLKNKSNNKYLGSDANDSGSNLFSDKDGQDVKHLWFMTTDKNSALPKVVTKYMVVPTDRRQQNEGWGVSLCWWANMCGKWSDSKIDQLVDWLTSPTGLNYNIFRYNIGGGDDPQNRNCTKHHMGNGKGLRAEMEGFKDSSDAEYDWTKDEAQRKIMLKIKEKRPDAIFEAFSNSCPYYMTYSGCVSGNQDGGKDNLKPEYYEEFAHYLVDVCKHYKDEYGIEFKTLEPFNEAMTSYWYANGVQEGCHFDPQSQIKFIKVLAPILKESGLNTIISASDETNVPWALATFEEYKKDGKALDLVGQWNTHTYSADDVSRTKLGVRCRAEGKTLWMSETGSGGNGIGGNLNLCQRMFDDIRCMMPSAWVDWQYVEENNDQWCLVKGNFSGQTATKVKNYYVRQQVSRHIKQGYHFITSLSPQSLAAVNEAGDSLVLVTINTGASSATHTVYIPGCEVTGKITCYQTSSSKNHQLTSSGYKYSESDKVLTLELPSLSISTFIIPINTYGLTTDRTVDTSAKYVIIPQYNSMMALTAKNKNVSIEQIRIEEDEDNGIAIDKAQQWQFVSASNKLYNLVNGNGERLMATSGYALTTSESSATGQTFSVDAIDGMFFKITNSTNKKSLDLNNESSSAGTQVGLWEYGNDMSKGHRNWYLCSLMDVEAVDVSNVLQSKAMPVEYYNLNGMKMHSLSTGINIVRFSDGSVKKIIIK